MEGCLDRLDGAHGTSGMNPQITELTPCSHSILQSHFGAQRHKITIKGRHITPLPSASSLRCPVRSTPGPAILSFKRPSFTPSPIAVTKVAETTFAPAPKMRFALSLLRLTPATGTPGNLSCRLRTPFAWRQERPPVNFAFEARRKRGPRKQSFAVHGLNRRETMRHVDL
jgi:hypothetical protein